MQTFDVRPNNKLTRACRACTAAAEASPRNPLRSPLSAGPLNLAQPRNEPDQKTFTCCWAAWQSLRERRRYVTTAQILWQTPRTACSFNCNPPQVWVARNSRQETVGKTMICQWPKTQRFNTSATAHKSLRPKFTSTSEGEAPFLLTTFPTWSRSKCQREAAELQFYCFTCTLTWQLCVTWFKCRHHFTTLFRIWRSVGHHVTCPVFYFDQNTAVNNRPDGSVAEGRGQQMVYKHLRSINKMPSKILCYSTDQLLIAPKSIFFLCCNNLNRTFFLNFNMKVWLL